LMERCFLLLSKRMGDELPGRCEAAHPHTSQH